MQELLELPEIREQKRPRYIPGDIAASSIQPQHARGIDTETLDGAAYLITFEMAESEDEVMGTLPGRSLCAVV